MKTAFTLNNAELWFSGLDNDQRHVATILALGYIKKEYNSKEKVLVYKYVLTNYTQFY